MEAKGQLKQAPHPMPSWICVMLIPKPTDDATPHVGADEELVLMLGDGRMVSISNFLGMTNTMERGINSGIVIEVGPLDVKEGLGEYIRYTAGCTVYFSEDKGIAIGDYLYLSATSVMAWEPEPE